MGLVFLLLLSLMSIGFPIVGYIKHDFIAVGFGTIFTIFMAIILVADYFEMVARQRSA